jgi:hypothetical protein
MAALGTLVIFTGVVNRIPTEKPRYPPEFLHPYPCRDSHPGGTRSFAFGEKS